jgi:hypothetical protein
MNLVVSDTGPLLSRLTVLIANRPVGQVEVHKQSAKKVWGQFIPNDGLAPYRQVFEDSVELARQFEVVPSSQPVDCLLWDRLMEAYERINKLKPILMEFPAPIEEFALDADWAVEITFVDPVQETEAEDVSLPPFLER